MPRMRDRILHPEFFTDAKLFDAEQESGLPLRLIYAGLWCAADREGRFEWKPRELKLTILPYDNVDFGAALQELVNRGFVQHYCANDVECGWIRKFDKWQHVHPKEARTKLPEPPDLKVSGNGVPSNSMESPVISPDSTSTYNSTFTHPPNGGSNGSRKRHPRGKPTWLSPYATLWTAGEPPHGQLARYLKPLHDQHGEPEVVRRWTHYLHGTDMTYWSPKRFSETWAVWDKAPATPGIADEPNFEWINE